MLFIFPYYHTTFWSTLIMATIFEPLLFHQIPSVQFSSVQSLSRLWLFATPWIVARQPSLSITDPQSSLKLTSIESVMPSSHLILCCPLFLLPPIPPSIRVFSNESTLCMRGPKYWSFSFSLAQDRLIQMEWSQSQLSTSSKGFRVALVLLPDSGLS